MANVEVFNLGLRLILEVATLIALAYLGITLGSDPLISAGLGIGLAAIAAMVWGTFVAPRGSRRLADPARLAVEILFFASGVVALFLAGALTAGVLLAAAVLLHFGLMFGFRLR